MRSAVSGCNGAIGSGPRSVGLYPDILLILWNALENVVNVSVHDNVFWLDLAIANGTCPAGTLFVDGEEAVGVKTLDMLTEVGTAWGRHSHIAERTLEAHGSSACLNIVVFCVLPHSGEDVLFTSKLSSSDHGNEITGGSDFAQSSDEDVPLRCVVVSQFDAIWTTFADHESFVLVQIGWSHATDFLLAAAKVDREWRSVDLTLAHQGKINGRRITTGQGGRLCIVGRTKQLDLVFGQL